MTKKLSPEEEKISSLLQRFNFAIIDASSARKSFRTLLSNYFVNPNHVESVDTISDAKTTIKKNKPNILFIDYALAGAETFELIKLQRDSLLSENLKFVFLTTTQDSNSLVSSAASENVDSVLIKPFNYATIKERFDEIILQKGFPSPYTKALEEGKARIQENKLDEALRSFQQAKTLDPLPALACAYEGEILQRLNQHENAIVCFEEGLKHNKTHFKSLIGIIDSLYALKQYEKAYETGKILSLHHTVPIKNIPNLIHLSVLNQRYEDIASFYETTNSIEHNDNTLASYIGAGMAICGIYFLRKARNAEAIDAFKKAETACNQNTKILTRILRALASAGLSKEMAEFVGRMPEEVRNAAEVRVAELEYQSATGSPYKALELAMDLIKQNTKDERLFEIALQLSVKLKRSESSIQEILFKATQMFPEKKSYFESLLTSPESSK